MNAICKDVRALSAMVRDYPRVVVLTGAGVSLGSGIPTYRDAEGRWRHSEPIKHQEFLANPLLRQRYWARSMRGWPAVRDARPNGAHDALASLERSGHVLRVITQNVDRLHQRAGSERVIDLHGRLDRVSCLDCGSLRDREDVQRQLLALNPHLDHAATASTRPDGDSELPDAMVSGVRIPACPRCQGVIMPDVVFFGGTVPRQRVETSMREVENADLLLAVGSSLQVYSGFRFCRRAVELGKPLVIINPGTTRADGLASLRIPMDCGQALEGLLAGLPFPGEATAL